MNALGVGMSYGVDCGVGKEFYVKQIILIPLIEVLGVQEIIYRQN